MMIMMMIVSAIKVIIWQRWKGWRSRRRTGWRGIQGPRM